MYEIINYKLNKWSSEKQTLKLRTRDPESTENSLFPLIYLYVGIKMNKLYMDICVDR